MSAMATPLPETPKDGEQRLGVPSRNPLPLSASQEAQVRDLYYQRVRNHCTEEIKAFAACALGRTFTVAFACRPEHRAMNGCMTAHATHAEYDASREEWFAQRLERQQERDKKRRAAAAQEEFMREWWGLPEEVRLSRQRQAAEQGKSVWPDGMAPGQMSGALPGERIGGMPARERRTGPGDR